MTQNGDPLRVNLDEAARQRMARRWRFEGFVLLLVAGLLWSLNGALIKLVNREGAHGVAIAFYRSLFAGLVLWPLAWGRFRSLATPGGVQRIGSIRPAAACCVIFFTLMTVCFVMANTMTEAANAIILQYTSTFWIFGLSPLIVGEKPPSRDFLFVAMAMIGIAVIFAGTAAGGAVGLLIALASGFFYALLTLMIRLLRNADSAAVTVVNNLGSALLLFPLAWLIGKLSVSGYALVLLIFMGIVQFGVPYFLYSLALRRVPAHQAALLTMIEPVLVPIWTYLAVGESVPTMTVVGGGVILFALLLFLRAAGRGPVASGEF